MPDASHNDAVLIFPAGMPRALEFLGQCRRQGRKALGASSLAYDPARQRYDRWLTLPYVTAADFDAALRRAVAEHGVTGIYTPHVVVWDYLNRRLADIAPGVALLNASPLDEELAAYRTALDAAPAFLSQPLPLASSLPAQPPQPEAEIAALLRHFAAIPGMCDLDKLKALYEIARRCPQGDVVEIGSWWGKSAFALLWLAQRYAIGKLLCVDPWENAQLLQHDADPLVDRLAADRLDADEALRIFQINLLPYSRNDCNYLRMGSLEAAAHYGRQPTVQTPGFGTTAYQGGIALLHIDGNHAYDSVKADIEAWSVHMADGGWIVVDDYRWPFGDGPRRAGDEFLQTHRATIRAAFVAGGALYLQRAAH